MVDWSNVDVSCWSPFQTASAQGPRAQHTAASATDFLTPPALHSQKLLTSQTHLGHTRHKWWFNG